MSWYKYKRETLPNPNERLNPLQVDFRVNKLKIINAFTASQDAIKKIVKKYPPPYTLLVSGGVDSQATLYAWAKSGIPFSAVTYLYGKNYDASMNIDDVATIIQFAKINNIKLDIRYFDALSFIQSSQLFKYAKLYDLASPHILTYIKLVENHPNETVIMSGNVLHKKSAVFNYTILGLERYKNKSKSNFVPFFLLYTPELAYSMLNYTPKDDFSLKDAPDNRWYINKCGAYQNGGFPVIPQLNKMTGFEKIKEYFDSYEVPFKLKIKYADMPSNRPFDFLFRYAIFDKIGEYSEANTTLMNLL